jgi:hypothetical protein
MHDTDDIASNDSGNKHIEQVIAARVSRRSVLGGTASAVLAGFLGGAAFAPATADATGLKSPLPLPIRGKRKSKLIGFQEVPATSADNLVVPAGYTWHVLAPWGTPLLPGAPAFREDGSNTAADQALQVGFNHDGMHYFPLPPFGNYRGLLALNHEYTDATQIYSAAQGSAITADAAGKEKVAKALAAHGVRHHLDSQESVLGQVGGRPVGSAQSAHHGRHADGVLGPGQFEPSVALLEHHPITPRDSQQLCAWRYALGYLPNVRGELERLLRYVQSDVDPYGARKALRDHRPGFRLQLAHRRAAFRRRSQPQRVEPLRLGRRDRSMETLVERTALGRFKHEGATCTESAGRIVVYSGDDQDGEYLYKFVGSAPWRHLRAAGLDPLDHGTLYVAKFNEDGSGEWLPLVHGVGPLTLGNGWQDQADVLIRTRMAADAVGATRLHRPEWVAVHPHTEEVYLTLTNGVGNTSAANSNRNPNPYGHILRLNERRGQTADTTFHWEVFLLAGDPAYDPAVPADQTVFGSPDGIWIDPSGIVWIQTDISNSSQNRPDRGYDNIGNNAMLAADPETGEVRRFLTGPRGCEVTGVIMTPDQRTMFVNIQHPGESTTFWDKQFGAPTTINPSTVSSWPFGGRPRLATVVIRKLDGGRIGS